MIAIDTYTFHEKSGEEKMKGILVATLLILQNGPQSYQSANSDRQVVISRTQTR